MLSRDKLDLYLDALADEYKDLLRARVLQGSRNGELSFNELLKLDAAVKNNLRSDSRIRKYKRIQLLGLIYILLGLVLALFALVQQYFLYSDSKFFVLLSMIMIIFGVYVAVLSAILQLLPRNTKSKVKKLEYTRLEDDILSLYSRLESIVQVKLTNSEQKTMRESISTLRNKRIISESEANILYSFLELRNRAIHYSMENDYANNESYEILRKVSMLLNKLYKTERA